MRRTGIGRKTGWLLAALTGLALSAPPLQAQTAAPASNLIDQLVGPETLTDIDLAALRQRATERIKSRADIAPLRRPLIAPQLTKLPQFAFDVTFDPDSSLIRPGSYQVIGRIADALTDPRLRPYVYLVVGHTDANGRRDGNLALSQRRADSIRDVLVSTFKVAPKRLQAIGLGEEQLQDALHPTAPANLGVQLIALGPLPAVPASETPVAAPKKATAAKKTGQKPRH